MQVKIRRYLTSVPHELYLFCIIFFCSFFVHIPYVNILPTAVLITTVIWVSAIILLKLLPDKTFFACLLLTFFALLSILSNQDILAEQIGNGIYTLMVIGTIQLARSYMRNYENE